MASQCVPGLWSHLILTLREREHWHIAAPDSRHTRHTFTHYTSHFVTLAFILLIQDLEEMTDKMEDAPGVTVTRSQPWPAPSPGPGSQVTPSHGAKTGASLTHLLAGAGLNGNNITMVSDVMREDYWLLTIL